ncbi:MAG: phytanoyl-CoA dioxygenase family protein, partial [Caldimonas sp.]
MPKILTQEQIETFWRDGCVFPIRVMSADEALAIRDRLEKFEAGTGGPLKGDLRHKSHLLFPWLDDVVHHSRIVDAIEDLYGPDLLCWSTNFFIKEKCNPAFVSWHQDSTYWGLSKPDVVTAWVALTASNEQNGAMAFIPG